MKKLTILLILSFIFTSCGANLNKHTKESSGTRMFATTDSTFSAYVKKFEEEGRNYYGANFSVGDIPINFGDTQDENYDGVCIKYTNGAKEIIIKKEWWDARDNVTSREMMIFHELGHCRLDKDHDNELIPTEDGTIVKTSLMNAVLPATSTYITYKAGYLAELFQNTKEVLKGLVASK